MLSWFNPHLCRVMLLYATELAVTGTLFCQHLPKRDVFVPHALLCTAGALGYIFLAPLQYTSYFIHIPLVVLAFLYIGSCYDIDLTTGLFLGISVYTVQCIESSVNSLLVMIDPDKLNHFGESITVSLAGYGVMLFSYLLTFLFVYLFFIRRMPDVDLHDAARWPVIALCIVVLTMNHFWAFGIHLAGEDYTKTSYAAMDYLWSIICCNLCLCIQFGIFNSTRKDRELEITRTLMSQREQQFKTTRSMVIAINKKCHQLKAQLGSLAQELDNRQEIDEAMELVDSFDAAFHTGNEVLDILFTEKNYYCLQSEITFVCMIDGEKLNFMQDTDLYVLFGNIIDNSVNAVRKMKDLAKRTIYVNVHAENQLLLVQVENPCEEWKSADRAAAQGFGMRSIRMVAEKYGGSVNIRAADGNFYLNLVFPLL